RIRVEHHDAAARRCHFDWHSARRRFGQEATGVLQGRRCAVVHLSRYRNAGESGGRTRAGRVALTQEWRSATNAYFLGLPSIMSFAVAPLIIASPDATIMTRRNPATKESLIDRWTSSLSPESIS